MRHVLLTGLTLGSLLAAASPPSQCSNDTDCESRCAERATDLASPKTDFSGFIGATCRLHRTHVIETMGCNCELTGGGAYVLHGQDAGCPVQGREAQCLFSTGEFQACDGTSGPNDALCGPQCDTLAERIRADKSRQLTVTVKGFSCYGTGLGGTCDCAFQVESTCVVNGVKIDHSTEYDCSRDPRAAIRQLSGRGCGCDSARAALSALGLLALARRRCSGSRL